MPTIKVEIIEGRTGAQKAALVKELTDACVRVLGSNAASVDVLFHDIPAHNWATGGELWSEKLAKPKTE